MTCISSILMMLIMLFNLNYFFFEFRIMKILAKHLQITDKPLRLKHSKSMKGCIFKETGL